MTSTPRTPGDVWVVEAWRNSRVELEKIEQHLGRALRYPKYPADWPHGDEFPYDADAVCIGDHVAETLAMEAADQINGLEAQVADLISENERLRTDIHTLTHRPAPKYYGYR